MKTKLKLTGMHCASCEMLIKDVLEDVEGITNVQVSFKNGTVSFDSQGVKLDKIKKILKEEGYGAEEL